MSGRVSGPTKSASSQDAAGVANATNPARLGKAISKVEAARQESAPAPLETQDHPAEPRSPRFSTMRAFYKALTPGRKNREASVSRPEETPYMLEQGNRVGDANLVEGTGNSSYTKPMNSTIEIYTQHFELKERPFTLLPDPDFLFWSPAHQRAFTMLEYGTLTGAPITLITGEVGAGKTTLLHHFLNNLDENVKVGLVSNAHGSRGELLRWVLMSLDQPANNSATYVDLFDDFQDYLISEYAAGNRVILIFDEAQNLSQESLEELRMFTNINANKDELLQLVLVGQPELRDIVQRPELRQFAQRVASSFHLNTMDESTTLAYIGHRLKKAGAPRNLFTESASRLVYQNTHGVPRLVNQLCDLSMVYAFAKNQKTVTLLTVEQVLGDGAFFGAPAPEKNDETA